MRQRSDVPGMEQVRPEWQLPLEGRSRREGLCPGSLSAPKAAAGLEPMRGLPFPVQRPVSLGDAVRLPTPRALGRSARVPALRAQLSMERRAPSHPPELRPGKTKTLLLGALGRL